MVSKAQINVFTSALCVLPDCYKGHAQYDMAVHLSNLAIDRCW